jgi:methanogenic corrinoid protein MtbC1
MYIIIRDMSAGNESVGDMWQETKVFNDNATLDDVMKWAMGDDFLNLNYSRKKITITRPHVIGKKE